MKQVDLENRQIVFTFWVEVRLVFYSCFEGIVATLEKGSSFGELSLSN
jgi:hypothetical protein